MEISCHYCKDCWWSAYEWSSVCTIKFQCHTIFHYRPLTSVIVTSLVEPVVPLVEFGWREPLRKQNAGWFGEGIVVSLPSMKTTVDIFGRSSAFSCTHRSPTWMHLKASVGGQFSLIDESTSSKTLPSCHSSHALRNSSSQQVSGERLLLYLS